MLSNVLPRLRRRIDVVRSSSLHLNAYALVLNQMASAALGVLYWMFAARLFSAEVVGSSSATISTLMLLGTIGSLNLKAAMIRFVPRSGRMTTSLVLQGYGISTVVSVLISLLFLESARRLQFIGELSLTTDVGPSWLIVATVVWCIFTVQDGVLTGLRQSVWVLVENQVFNIAKMALLVLTLWFADEVGITASWFLPAGVLVLVVNAFIFLRLIPRHVRDETVQVAPVDVRQAMPSVTGDYLGSTLSEIGVRMLPLMVVHLLGASATAYFYQAWLISVSLNSAIVSMASSFTAESSANRSLMRDHSLSILRQMSLLVIPASLLVALAAPLLLSLFGPAYAEQGTPLLRYLALTAPISILSTWYIGYARVKFHTLPIILIQGLPGLLTLGLSYLWLPAYGIAGIGLAWLVSNVLVTGWVVVKSVPFLFGWDNNAERDEGPASLNDIWRRVDWRFFLPSPRPRLSAYFSRGLIVRAIEAISDEAVDGRQAPSGECDLAVVSDPTTKKLVAAHRSLRSGGACYTEWAAWRTGGTRGIRRQLASAGFSDIRLYWAYPGPDQARFWLPLPAGRAACGYLATYLSLGQSRVSRLVVRILCEILQVALRVGLVPKLSAVAYKGNDREMDLLETLDRSFRRSHPVTSPGQLSFLVLTGGFRVDSSIDCLVFEGTDPEPRWVAKIPRLPISAGGLHNEERMLSDLTGVERYRRGAMIPAVVDRFSLGDVQIHVQTAVTGSSLKGKLSWDNFDQIAAQMAEFQIWLAGLASPLDDKVDCLAYADAMLASLADQHGPLLDARTISEVRAAMASVGVVRRTLAHNDFSPWNMRCTQAGLGVFDWVEAGWDNLPLTDLVYGLATVAFQLDRCWDTSRMLSTYRTLLDESTPAGAVFKKETSRYARHCSLSESQVAALRMFTWIRHGSSELQDFRVAYGSDAGRRWLHESVCLSLLRVELGMREQVQEIRTVVQGGVGV